MAIKYQIKYKLDEVYFRCAVIHHSHKWIRVTMKRSFGIYEDYNLGQLIYTSVEKTRNPLNSTRILANLEL